MAYKDILVHLDSAQNLDQRLAMAARLAREHDAHLTGLFVRTPPHIPPFVQAQLGSEVMELQQRRMREAAEGMEARFDEFCRKEGLQKHEFRSPEGDPVEVLRLHGRYTDLVVIGQVDPEDETVDPSLPDHIILDVGRPVLVVPYVGTFDRFAEHVMVAWSGTRESIRAVDDAMPLMQAADKVSVMAIDPSKGIYGDLPGADLALHLARHDVTAEAEHIHSGDVDPGNMLLSRVSDESVDLLVMGAYGRSRLREVVLGGVTRTVLQHMTCPVLMAH